MAYSITRDERVYLQNQTTLATILNSAGTATVANANACRHTRVSLDPHVSVIQRMDKTGQRHRTPGVKGRQGGSWSYAADLAANGAAGVEPDSGPILRAIWGVAPTISGGVSVTYPMTNGVWTGLSLWSFRTPSGLAQRVSWGSVVRSANFNFNEQGAATFSVNGESCWVLDSKRFASSTATEKAGLTTFPVEPSAPVTNGNIVAGFVGSVSIAAQTAISLKGANLTISRNDTVVRNNFGEYTAQTAEGDEMDVSLGFTIDDEDAAAVQTIKDAAFSKATIAVTLALGATAGNIWTFTIPVLQLEPFQLEENDRRYKVGFSASRAYPSSLTATDICTLVIT